MTDEYFSAEECAWRQPILQYTHFVFYDDCFLSAEINICESSHIEDLKNTDAPIFPYG